MSDRSHLSSLTISGKNEYVQQVVERLALSFHIFSRFDRQDTLENLTVGLVLTSLPSWFLPIEQELEKARESLATSEEEKEQMAAEIERLKEELGRLPKPRHYDAVLGGFNSI